MFNRGDSYQPIDKKEYDFILEEFDRLEQRRSYLLEFEKYPILTYGYELGGNIKVHDNLIMISKHEFLNKLYAQAGISVINNTYSII